MCSDVSRDSEISTTRVVIVHYPQALQSAVFGLQEAFQLANRACGELALQHCFSPEVSDCTQLSSSPSDLVILPPSLQQDYYLKPDKRLLTWLQQQHQQGAVLASACAGSFILAAAGLLDGRSCTTHWGLAELFKQHYPTLSLRPERLLITHGDIVTAGGMMAWVDLALELIGQTANAQAMRAVGKMLVVDTSPREQRYYQQFRPNLQHGDQPILAIQQQLSAQLAQALSVQRLAEHACMSQRNLLRRFSKATGFSPQQYLQRLRVQQACELLESTTQSSEQIALAVGYHDHGAFRKTFIRVMGLSPAAFRRRFA